MPQRFVAKRRARRTRRTIAKPPRGGFTLVRKSRPPVNRSTQLTAKAPLNRINNRDGFPTVMFTKLKYYDHITLTLLGGDFAVYKYNMNSLGQPKPSSSDQPRYHDQYSLIYSKYQVYGAKVKVRAFTKDTSAEGFILGLMGLSDTNTTPASYKSVVERGLKRVETTLSNTNNVARNQIQYYFKPWLVQGVTKSQYHNDQEFYTATTSNSPLQIPQIVLYSHTMDETTSTFGVECLVEITFYAKYFSRKLPSAS